MGLGRKTALPGTEDPQAGGPILHPHGLSTCGAAHVFEASVLGGGVTARWAVWSS